MNSRFFGQPHTPGEPVPSQPQGKRPHPRNARVLNVGIVLSILLLASVITSALVLRSTHSSAYASGGAPTPTPTPISGTPAPGQPLPQGSLYVAAPGSLSSINLKTSNVNWTISATDPETPLVVGKTLFFNNGDSSDLFLEAASAKTGTQIWNSTQYFNGFLQSAGHMLYDSTCDFSAISDPCHLYGINAATGAQLWSYDLPQGDAWITLHNGVLYGVSSTSYFALNALTGVPLWQQNLLNYTDQEGSMAPVISGNVLSFASCDTTKGSSDYLGCYLYAFNARTGQELWHLSTTSSLEATPTIMGGVVYAGGIDGSVLAVDEQNGTQLWSANAGGPIGQLLASAGSIYVEVIGGAGLNVEAFDAATHALRWGPTSSVEQSPGATVPLALHSTLSGGPASNPFVLEHGLIYIQNGANTIDVLSARDGSLVAQYSGPGGFINGFAVVAQ